MGKTEVYSWRVDPELKAELEAAARRDDKSVGAVIDEACREWLGKSRTMAEEDAARARRRKILMEAAGSVDGPGVSATNRNVREAFHLKRQSDDLRRRAPRAR